MAGVGFALYFPFASTQAPDITVNVFASLNNLLQSEQCTSNSSL